MNGFSLKTPKDVRLALAKRAKDRRLMLNISQTELSERTGASLSSIKRFENSGEVSLKTLLEIALVLSSLEGFDGVFAPPPVGSLFEKAPKKRLRSGRKRSLFKKDAV